MILSITFLQNVNRNQGCFKNIINLYFCTISHHSVCPRLQVNLQGQKQQALGGAGVATNLDATSVFYNPGSISHLEGNSVSASISLTSGNTAFRDRILSNSTILYLLCQIVFIGKLFCDQNWESLSIPKGKSTNYNAEKFSGLKGKKHFTDEYLEKGR